MQVKKVLCTAVLAIGSLQACAGVEYMDSSYFDTAGQQREIHAQHLGAFLVQESESQEKPRIIRIKRESTGYVAETPLIQKGQAQSFDELHFAFGSDSRKNSIGLRLRFVY